MFIHIINYDLNKKEREKNHSTVYRFIHRPFILEKKNNIIVFIHDIGQIEDMIMSI